MAIVSSLSPWKLALVYPIIVPACSNMQLRGSSRSMLFWSSSLAALLILVLLIYFPNGEATRSGPLQHKETLTLLPQREILQVLGSQQWTAKNIDFLFAKDEEDEANEAEEEDDQSERHPADELLQRHKADGTVSYILGGY